MGITLIEELRKYKAKPGSDDHAVDALRYAFIANKLEYKKRRTNWLKIVIVILVVAVILWLFRFG